MTDLIRPGVGLLFMKVGTHAQETLDDIIVRKTREIEDTGYGLWGYGGNTCHPRTMVQPFAEICEEREMPIYLCMNEMHSNHFAEPIRAQESSADSVSWSVIPPTINVMGSRFALVIQNLRREDFILPLSQTRVAIGNQLGRAGNRYIQGHVDKACLEFLPNNELSNNEAAKSEVKISLVADLVAPYAVFLRNNS